MPQTAPPVLLISTDFDGTLVEHGSPAPFSPLLVEILHALRRRGVRWAINTGRTLSSLEEGLDAFALPIHPDFALTSERHIFRPAPNGHGWVDYGDWNKVCARRHRELFASAAPALAELVRYVERETRAELVYGRHSPAANASELAGLIATSDAEMQEIVAVVDAFQARVPNFSYQRNSIYMSFCHSAYDKGTTLAELGRLTGVPAESIFAIGDHQNDLPMLTGTHARHVACPGNAIDEVKQAVREANGYVARDGYSAGVIEALRFYCADLGV